MRSIVFIAAFETRKFFYSPIAWTVMAIFIVQLSFYFTSGLEGLVENQFLSSEGYRRNYSMRVFLSSGRGGVFDVIQSSLFLYIPLLSMGLMSRELDSGSVKLLLSSSIRPSSLVLGKVSFYDFFSAGICFYSGMFWLRRRFFNSGFPIPNIDTWVYCSATFVRYLFSVRVVHILANIVPGGGCHSYLWCPLILECC